MTVATQFLLLVILIILSGFFSGSEVALISLSKLKVRQMVENKKLGAEYVKKLKDNPHRMLATILIGNNLVNVAASAITTSIMIGVSQNYAVGIATGIMTLVILIFGELTPKSLATENSEMISQLIAAPIWYLSIAFAPLIYVLDFLLSKVFRITGNTKGKKEFTEEKIRSMVAAAEEEGSIKKIEKKMIHNIFEFDDINVSEIATPRNDMVTINPNAKVSDAAKLILKKSFSRIPVYDKHQDKIVGIVYEKDLLKNLDLGKGKIPISKIMKKPFFVPETKKISSMLRQFQKKKKHMALVVDEHGAITGLVTLEDVLEEIVGEIMDETDKVDPNIRQINKKSWYVSGKTELDELNEEIKIDIQDGDYDTVSGFILKHTGKIPKEGEQIIYNDFKLTIEEIDNQRISQVKVERI